MLRLQGNVGMGHVRYPTAGGAGSDEAQPFYVNSPYGICLAHNGNLVNYDELAGHLIGKDRRHLNTDSDSEVLLNVFAHELQIRSSGDPTPEQIFDAIEAVHRRCSGGYAVVAMIVGVGIVAFRDPHGIRPLIMGKRETADGDAYMVASESVALNVLQFDVLRDVRPGEAVFIEEAGVLHSRDYSGPTHYAPCIFEFVYFARPDSIIDKLSVYKARLRMGEQLAGQDRSRMAGSRYRCRHSDTGHEPHLGGTGRATPGRQVPRGIHQESLHRPHVHHARAGGAGAVGAAQAERHRSRVSRQERAAGR